jgi:hypothetical protein
MPVLKAFFHKKRIRFLRPPSAKARQRRSFLSLPISHRASAEGEAYFFNRLRQRRRRNRRFVSFQKNFVFLISELFGKKRTFFTFSKTFGF